MRGTLRILATDGIPLDILADDGPKATQHLHFGIAHDIGIQRIRRLHRDKTQQL